ncbi:MAG: HEAT repeat domain-containing protein [Planctomycetota bacterium]
MSPKPLGVLLVVFALGGGLSCVTETPREKFVRLLHEVERELEAARPPEKPLELTPLQKERADRLKAAKKKDPKTYAAADGALERFESPNPAERRAALLVLARCGEVGETFLRFVAGFFDPRSPSDFDALLAKIDDPAILHLRRDALTGEGEIQAEAARALDLILDVKTRCLLQWLDHRRGDERSAAHFEIAAARDRALEALAASLNGRDPNRARLALCALEAIGTPGAARILAEAAVAGSGKGATPEGAVGALARMDADVSVPVLAALLEGSKVADPLPLAWTVAEKALAAHGPVVKDFAASEDPDLRLAGLAGELRLLGRGGEAIERLALAENAAADPLPFLHFLHRFPHLAAPFSKPLCALSRSRRDRVRAASAFLLAFTEDDGTIPALREALIDSEASVRLAAAEAAARRLRSGADPVLLEGLRRASRDRDAAIKRVALLTLGRARDEASRNLLLERLQEGDTGDVEGALEAIALFRDPGLLAEVPLRLYWGSHTRARSLLVKALVMASDPSAAAAVRTLIATPHVDQQRFALTLLDPETASGVLPILHGFTSQNDEALKAGALRMLSRCGDTTPAGDPIPHLTDPSARVVREAVRALARGGSAFEKLSGLSEALNPVVREEALAALASTSEAKAVRRFEAGVFEGNAVLRRLAVRALGRIGDPQSLPYLVFASADPNRRVRIEAAQSLGAVKGERAMDVLVRLTEDPDPNVRAAAVAALERQGKPAPELRSDLRKRAALRGPFAGAWLLMDLGEYAGAASRFDQGLRAGLAPHRASLDAARARALAGDGEGALAALSKARDLGFDAVDDLRGDEAFRSLIAKEGFAERMDRLFRPEREGRGFLDRFHGPIKLYLRNGSSLSGRLLAFRDERFVLLLPEGESEIPKRQVEKIQFEE